MDSVRSAIDLFLPDSTDTYKTTETFRIAVNNWSKLLTPQGDFLTCLFMILVARPEYSKTLACRVSPDGPLVIQLHNKHPIEICITAKRGHIRLSNM